MKRTTISIVSHNLPSVKEPYLHPFIVDHYQAVDHLASYSPLVLCPAPIGIPGTRKWSRQFGPILNAPNGQRFSYLSLPRRKGAAFVRLQIANTLLALLPPPDETIVHLHWLYPVGIVAPLLKKKGYRVVLMVHGGDWRESVDRPDLVTLFQEALLSADTVLVSGKTLGEEITEVIPGLRYEIMGNYIDTERFTHPSSDEIEQAKRALGWDPTVKHLLCVANLRPEKGIDLLLEALQTLHATPFKVHIIGQTADSDYQTELEHRLQGLPPHLVNFYKPVSRDTLVQFYHASDGFILPSRAEGFNVSLLEAAATGLPLIATEAGDSAEVLAGCDGYLTPINQPLLLAKSIEKWSLNENHRNKTSSQFILDHFSFQVFRKRLEELYDRL